MGGLGVLVRLFGAAGVEGCLGEVEEGAGGLVGVGVKVPGGVMPMAWR